MWLKLRNHPLFWITASGVILRLTYFLLIITQHPEGFWAYDSGEYWRLAENLFNYGEFSKSNGAPFEAEHLRTPLYPIFLGLIQEAGGGLYAAIILQLILEILTIPLIWKSTLNFGGNQLAAGIAAIFGALDIPSVVFGNFILSETLYVFLLALCILFLSRYTRNLRWNDLALFGFFTGLSALCRPSSILLIALWSVLLFFLQSKPNARIKTVLIYLTASILTIFPWIHRNQNTFDKVFFSTTSDFMLAAWHAPNVKAIVEDKTVAQARYELWSEWYYNAPYDAYKEPIDYMKFIRKKSLALMKEHPGIVVKQHFTGVFHLLFKPARGQFLQQLYGETDYQPVQGKDQMNILNNKESLQKTPVWVWAMVAFQFMMLAAIYAGLLVLILRFNRTNQKKQLLFMAFTALLLINLIVPPVTNARFRMPVMPFLCVLSGIGISLVKENRQVI